MIISVLSVFHTIIVFVNSLPYMVARVEWVVSNFLATACVGARCHAEAQAMADRKGAILQKTCGMQSQTIYQPLTFMNNLVVVE